MRPPFPAVIDSSMRGAFVSCPRKFELEYIHHWKPREPSIHLHAGAAYAKGLEVAREAFFVQGRSAEASIAAGAAALIQAYGSFDCPPESAKSADRMLGALIYYFDQYPLETETATPVKLPGGCRGIEFSFAEPLEVEHPETGDPIIYCGRMDQLVEFAGAIFGEDDKTTGALGANWNKQWDLRAQFTGYVWGAQRVGIPVQGFLIRGLGVMKTKFDTLQCVTYRPQWQIDRWYGQLLRDIRRMIACWEEGYWDYNLDHACAEYGGCMFREICLSKDPAPFLAASFRKRRWDPLTREEVEL